MGMSAVWFGQLLMHDGAVRVPAPSQTPDDWGEAAAELDRAFRPEMPYNPPLVDEPAAAWGVRILYRSCQLLVYREVDGQTVNELLDERCPAAPCPAV